MRVETPTSANRQTALSGRARGPAVLAVLRITKVGRMVTLAPPEEEWVELEEIVLQPQGEEGQGRHGSRGLLRVALDEDGIWEKNCVK